MLVLMAIAGCVTTVGVLAARNAYLGAFYASPLQKVVGTVSSIVATAIFYSDSISTWYSLRIRSLQEL